MGALFSALFAKIAAVAQWCIDLVKQLAKDVYEMLTDIPVWCFDQILGLVTGAVGELDLSGLDTYTAGAWTTLPGEVINALAYLGAAEVSVIILTAIGIRLVLQLIPFVRLGS